MAKTIKIVTPEFRVSYPSVFKPALNKLSNKQEYTVQALFKKGEDLSKVQLAIQQAVIEKWGPDKAKWPKNLRIPLRDQGDQEKEIEGKTVLPNGYERGAKWCRLKSEQRPGVVDQNVQPILDESQFYAGCWARASVNVAAYSQMGNNGVSLYLNNLQKVRDGDAFGSRTKAEDDFVPVAVEGETPATIDGANSLFN